MAVPTSTREAAPPRPRIRLPVPPALAPVLSALGAVALVLFLTRKLLLEYERFPGDFQNDAWYIHHQAAALRDTHLPSLSLTAQTAAMYPFFAFYGGTLFTIAAALALVTGEYGHLAEAVVYVLALASAYGGWFWLARQAGVRGWIAHAPAIAYVTAPYVLTNIYWRQDFAESVATNTMPLMVAAALSVARADRLRPGPALALAVSTVVFTGSHNLTLLYGTTFLLLTAALVLAAVPAARGLLSRRAVLRVLVVVVPAVAVNAWFLLPDLFYSHQTTIGVRVDEARALLRKPDPALGLGHLLTPTRPDTRYGGGNTLPVLVLAWALLAAAVMRPRGRTAWWRALAIMVVLVVAVAVLTSHARVLAGLPSPWPLIQFGMRLGTFALFALCGALIAALALVGRPRRWLVGLLAVVLAVGVAQAAHQISKTQLPPPYPKVSLDRAQTFGLGDYADGTLPVIQPPADAPVTTIIHRSLDDGAVRVTVQEGPGDMFLTNVLSPKAMLEVEGARIVGVWEAPPASPTWQKPRFLVLQIDPGARGDSHTIVVRTARTAPIVAGRVVSLLGLLGLAAVAAFTWRARRRGPRPPRRPRGAAADGSATPGPG
jgi:hypothetical protein